MSIEAFGVTLQFGVLQFIILTYVLVINVVAFFTYGVDKWKARGDRRRVSEKRLWLLVLLGGTFGALFGMKLFRHKTKKIAFQFVLALIILLQVLLVAGIFWLIVRP